MRLSRRGFLRASSLATAGTLAPCAVDSVLAAIAGGAVARAPGFGPLVPDPMKLLDLPEGFRYLALSSSSTSRGLDPEFQLLLASGEPVPCRHDGMHAFAGRDGGVVIVRNHELEPGQAPIVPPGPRPYDPIALAGTTTLWVSPDRRLLNSFVSLSGTYRNCAGGPTPWGSWLTCEECTYIPGAFDETNGDRRPDVSRPHGYVFEVDSRASEPVEPVPIRAMGRFYHEAVAVDPRTGFVYLTEDRDDGLLYRYRPDVVTSGEKRPSALGVGDLARGGVLEALRVVGRSGVRTQNWEGTEAIARGARHKVDWIRIPEIEPEMDMERDPDDANPDVSQRREHTAPGSIRAQGFTLGAAQFARMEGITYDRGALYACATNGGPEKAGQVWKLDLARQQLSLFVQPDNRALLEGPDNICAAPNGDLIVCEDGRGDDYLVGITAQGRLYPFARNAHNDQEFAGATFSPDGRTLFVNVQEPGITFAIWGPWSARRG